MPSARQFFNEAEQQEIVSAIRRTEKMTSGEIRVHIEDLLKGDVLDRAAVVFRQLKMDKTKERNGVLIYLAIRERKFAVIGDEGIHQKVKTDFWDGVKEGMQAEFSQGRFLHGVIQAVEQAGEQLKSYFPISASDKNELSDEITFRNE
jgi:uncharacterized membrane protein